MVHPAHARPPRALNLVRRTCPEEADTKVDWSPWYLSEEDDMGQGPEQDDVVATLASSLEELGRERSWTDVKVGRDAFFAWIPSEPNVRVSPDVYLLDRPPAPPWPRMWQTWLPDHRPPRFALEVVSEDWRKDYLEVPSKYALLGATELVIHDPEASRGGVSRKRVPLQVFRRTEDDAFVCVYRGPGPARVETLDAWVVRRPDNGVGWLRLSRDDEGTDIVRTSAERAVEEAARAEREAARAAEEAARAEQEAARAEREAARADRMAARLRALGIEAE